MGSSLPLTVTAPFDGAEITSLPTDDAGAIEASLTTAARLFRDRDAWLPLWRRIEILERAAELMRDRIEPLTLQAAREGGKPLLDSRVEVVRAVEGFKAALDGLRSEAGEVVPMGLNRASAGRIAFTQKEPVGPVVAVSAFNHPVNLIVHQVVPAVAAGCPVIVKPAEDTPLSCRSVAEILVEAGLPPEWCRVVHPADLSLAEALVTDPRVGFFSFIGSARVGWHLRSKLAPGTRCALEHGGAAPVIVAADAELGEILPSLLKGGFYHAGQVCVSVQRVFAARRVARALAEALAEGAAKLAVGDPTGETTEVGPLIRPGEVTRVSGWVEEAGAARALTGGRKLSDRLYAPTVLYDPPADSRVSTQEVFGPVVCVYPYDALADAVARANALPFAFQAAVFTRDLEAALAGFHRLRASAVMVNDHTAFRVDWMPFAGLGQSGLGVGGIPHTLRDMQTEKMLVLQSPLA